MAKFRYKTVRARKGLKGRRVYGAFASRPGEPPRKQTGRGRASVTYEIDEDGENIHGRVGTNVFYMRILELEMNRPWLRRALAECQSGVNGLLSQMRG